MSDGRIITDLKKLMRKYNNDEIMSKLEMSKIHRVTFTTQETTAAFVNGTVRALEKIFPGADQKNTFIREMFLKHNTKFLWNVIIRRTFYRFINGGMMANVLLQKEIPLSTLGSFKGFGKSAIYVRQHSTAERFTIEIRNPNANKHIRSFCAALRKYVWKEWCEDAKSSMKEVMPKEVLGTEMSTGDAHAAFSETTHYAHKEETTIGLERTRLLLEGIKEMDIEADLHFYDETIDLPSFVLNEATLELKTKPNFDNQGVLIGEERAVEGTMKQQTDKETTDFAQIRSRILNGLPAFFNKHRKDVEQMSDEDAFKASGSRSLKQDVTASNARATVDSIVTSLKKAGVKGKTVKTKAPLKKRPSRNVTYTHRTPNKSKIIKGSVRLAGSLRGLTAGPKEKGASEGSLAELTKLKKKINKRLPAEVRRNMGRPALINRTGRFSNSAELLNLRNTAGGISGSYTYQKAPYETFENSGRKRWPMGYNPKPLIAKSIRQLAMQYTKIKVTQLRRI